MNRLYQLKVDVGMLNTVIIYGADVSSVNPEQKIGAEDPLIRHIARQCYVTRSQSKFCNMNTKAHIAALGMNYVSITVCLKF